MNFTERQLIALANPVSRFAAPLRTPASCGRKQGKWGTILEVARESSIPWTWMASASRERFPGSVYKLSQWKSEWLAEAEQILRELMHGVGGEEIVRYPFDVMRYGANRLTTIQIWRPLLPEEIEAITGAVA